MTSILSAESQRLFPLRKISDLETLFRVEFLNNSNPDLGLLSIILGAIEHNLVHLDYAVEKPVRKTVIQIAEEKLKLENPPLIPSAPVVALSCKRRGKGRGRIGGNKVTVDFKNAKRNTLKADPGLNGVEATGEKEEREGESHVEPEHELQSMNNNVVEAKEDAESYKKSPEDESDFPPLSFQYLEDMYLKFKAVLSLVNIEEFGVMDSTKGTPKEVVKRVSDVVWYQLSRSYKADTPHIQSLYTYLLDKKLDSFGVAMGVVAGCQILGLNDVHLALSEDHSWVIFGPHGEFTSEVTWHGKGVEDKRGQPAGVGEDESSWIYLRGQAVRCTRFMELAAIVASMNFNVNSSMNSAEVVKIQQQLLWALYDEGHLEKYPMGLMCLAELEEIQPSLGKKSCISLFQQAIRTTRSVYSDMHIYPYSNFAGYLYRQHDYKSALKYWAHAARVVQKYNRSKSDEEIYREFLEISTDYLMNVMKQSSTGFSAHSIMRDPCSFAQLLRFFDGVCMWEENSRSPIVHITWAKAWVSAIGKFDYTIRRMVQVTLADGEEKENSKTYLRPRTTSADEDHEKASLALSKDVPQLILVKSESNSNEISESDALDIESDKLPASNDTTAPSMNSYIHSSLLVCSTPCAIAPANISLATNVIGISICSPDSGIDEEEIPSSAVTLYSEKMQQLKDLIKRDKYNPGAITLLLTAQSATATTGHLAGKTVEVANASANGRPKRERLSHHIESVEGYNKDEESSGSAKKRIKFEKRHIAV